MHQLAVCNIHPQLCSDLVSVERCKWGWGSHPSTGPTDSCITIAAPVKRCHRDKCAGDVVNPNLLNALREINGLWVCVVAARCPFLPRSSLIAIKSSFTFWCSFIGPVPMFRWARKDLAATLMPSLHGLSITHVHIPQVKTDRCGHSPLTTEPWKRKWWNAGSRGSCTHTQTPTRWWLRNALCPWVQLQPRIDFLKEMENLRKKHCTLQKMISGRPNDL